MKTHPAILLMWAGLLAACNGGNGDTTGGGGAGGQGGAGGAFPTHGANVSLTCTDDDPACNPPSTYHATVDGSTLDYCHYADDTKAFEVHFVGNASEIRVAIADFTGVGSYTTAADGTTIVVMRGAGDVPSDADSTSNASPCTIAVDSNLADIQIPDTGDAAILDVSLEVSCPMLMAGGVCVVQCTPSPSTFGLSVGGCIVSP